MKGIWPATYKIFLKIKVFKFKKFKYNNVPQIKGPNEQKDFVNLLH